jgi:hypothetical protein
VKVLALAFLLLIGMTLIAEGFGQKIPKGYVYASMAFSVFVELLNIGARRKSNHGAVGEGDARRAVPGFHERRVVAVERALLRAHRGVVLPRFGNHHQDGVRQRAPGEVQQLDYSYT